MNLWIRSQDKERLIKVSNVQYTYRKGDLYSDVRGKHYIGTYYDNLEILGEYTTKERALEILNEIQNILKPKIIYNQSNPIETMNDAIYQIKQDVDMKIQELSTYVYEMPEE